MKITEYDVINKGLDWVKTLDEFEIHGDHYNCYPSVLDGLKYDYNINTEYFGNSDQGTSITKFKRKENDQVIQEYAKNRVDEFCDRWGLCIESWSIKDRDKIERVIQNIHK